MPASVDEAMTAAIDLLNSVAGTPIVPFEYEGQASPETVFVVHGAHEASQIAHVVARTARSAAVGVVKVRVPFPFARLQFLAAIPASVRTVVIAPEYFILKAEVSSALFLTDRFATLKIADYAYPVDFVWTPITVLKVLAQSRPTRLPQAHSSSGSATTATS